MGYPMSLTQLKVLQALNYSETKDLVKLRTRVKRKLFHVKYEIRLNAFHIVGQN